MVFYFQAEYFSGALLRCQKSNIFAYSIFIKYIQKRIYFQKQILIEIVNLVF